MSIKFVDPNALALLSALIAIDLADGLDLEDQNVAGNFITAIGTIMLTMASAEEAQKRAAEEQAAKIKTKEKAGAEGKTETTQTPKGESIQVAAGEAEDEFIGREREDHRRRIEYLEHQVRQLAAALEGKS